MSCPIDLRRALVASAFALSVLPSAATGHAQSAKQPPAESSAATPAESSAATPARKPRAAELFELGRAAAARKDWQRAFELFHESYELSPSHDTAANLGHTALKLERPDQAARYLSRALQTFPPTGNKKKRDQLEHYVQLATRHVETVRLDVTPAEAEIVVDGKPMGRASKLIEEGGAVFLAPGRRSVQALLDGYTPRTESVVAEAGGERTLRIALVPAATATTESSTQEPSPPPATAPHDASAPGDPRANGRSDPNLLPPALIGGGIALASLGLGIGFSVAASSATSDADDLERTLGDDTSCGAGTPFADPCAALRDRREAADNRRNIATVAFVGAGVAAVGTVAYVLWASSESRRGAARVAPRLTPHAGISPAGAALSVSGAF
jgi:tetratricopeptide (TPR) repeat protein